MPSFEEGFAATKNAADSVLNALTEALRIARQRRKASQDGNIAAIKRLTDRLDGTSEEGSESVRKVLFAVQRGLCPGCGFSLPHFLRCDLDYVVPLCDDGRTVECHAKLL